MIITSGNSGIDSFLEGGYDNEITVIYGLLAPEKPLFACKRRYVKQKIKRFCFWIQK